ncbi:hypothetical protein D3C86_1569520 [compost metagenome]
MVEPESTMPTVETRMPRMIEWMAFMRLKRAAIGTIRKTMAPASMLIIHSGWICPPARPFWSIVGLLKVLPSHARVPEVSTQSSMKLGKRSKSWLNISQ